MRRLVLAPMVLGAGLALAGCHSVSEETTNRPTAVPSAVPPQLVVVVPVPIPTPITPAPAPVDGPVTPPAPGNPVVTPVPTPGSGGGGEPPVTNTSPVAKVGVKVFFVECNGQMVPGSEGATSAQVGCRVHLDATPKDSGNNPTIARGSPSWSFSNEGPIKVGYPNPYNPVMNVTGTGSTSVNCTIDGVTSNTIRVSFY